MCANPIRCMDRQGNLMVHNPTTMKSLLGLGRFLNRLVSFRDLCSSRYVLENNCFFFKSVSNKVSVCRHQKTVNTKRLKFLYGDKTWFDLCCVPLGFICLHHGCSHFFSMRYLHNEQVKMIYLLQKCKAYIC